jgi:DNA-binding HxlR family transcriptional regulator
VSPDTELTSVVQPGPSAERGLDVAGRPRVCPIADALDLVGDRWSLLILREISFGVARFNDIRSNVGAPRDTLTTRLRKLEEGGVVERHRYCEHPPRDEYVLTEAGRAIGPVLRSLYTWGQQHARPSGGPTTSAATPVSA